ncbi:MULTISPECIES: alpha-ketoglutarate-dependent dioxygenase AlkB [Dyella]|uniref:Methyladenine dioxygenase n=2 Tax=Dyella TaxID=231454 RepID=A0A4R0YY63_9GAMM|nr:MULTISPECIES: alpha-ketoglutarate-dependent dioxygenase AlkB [Dyella]TBR40460.1 methyladenine dioxygenase [Dyella terrae]TCI11958.1 methyladenine dioxygenase [Dyella soli]
MQASFFDNGPRSFIDDATGPLVYYPDVVGGDIADAWHAQLFRQIDWRFSSRMMYERVVEVPRLHTHYRLDDASLPEVVTEALAVVRSYVDAPFNSVGLNLYRDENDSVAPHNDRLDGLVEGEPIVLLSLGAVRQLVVRRKEPPHRKLTIDMEPGSLLVMGWSTQLHYDHGIPKLKHRTGSRISLAFRVRKPDQNTDD